MSEENKALSRRAIEEVFVAGNLDVVDEIISEDHVHHDPAMPEEGHGREHFKEFASMYRSAFPDVHVEIEDMIAEGDRILDHRLFPCTEFPRMSFSGSPVSEKNPSRLLGAYKQQGSPLALSWSSCYF